MQRILRINVKARNAALRKARKESHATHLKDWRDYGDRYQLAEKERARLVKEERNARRDDWLKGPLAPNRDAGSKQGFYGTVTQVLSAGPVFPPDVRRGPKSNGHDPFGKEARYTRGDAAEDGGEEEHVEWEGYGNEGNIVPGDRVCVVRGRKSILGQIGRVKSVNEESREITLEQFNTVTTLFLKMKRRPRC
jgi:hypothetical protein